MSITQTSRLMSPEEIATQAGQQAPLLRLPTRASLFLEREQRLRQLAAGHAMRGYLLFAAELVRAQHALLNAYPSVVLPTEAAIATAADQGEAVLAASTWPRDAAWREGLQRILRAVAERMPDAEGVQAAISSLASQTPEQIERQADRLLSEMSMGVDPAAAPFIGAALQAYFTHMVLAVSAEHESGRLGRPAPFGLVDDMTRCPCCASRPTASIQRLGDSSGYRYLHCALCSTEWHMVRIKCAQCQSTKGIGYRNLEPVAGFTPHASAVPAGAVQAETCDECGHYLKIVNMGKDPHVEPVADDLASLTLDLLTSEQNFNRHGLNLLIALADEVAENPGGPPPDPGAH